MRSSIRIPDCSYYQNFTTCLLSRKKLPSELTKKVATAREFCLCHTGARSGWFCLHSCD